MKNKKSAKSIIEKVVFTFINESRDVDIKKVIHANKVLALTFVDALIKNCDKSELTTLIKLIEEIK